MAAVLQNRVCDVGAILVGIGSWMSPGRTWPPRATPASSAPGGAVGGRTVTADGIAGPAGSDDPPALDAGESAEDASLVLRSQSDPEAFGLLYDRYCDRIYGYVYRRLRDREAAEDVTAEIFIKALKAIDTYRPEIAPFAAWLYRIAGNAVIDHVRARRVMVSIDAVADAADAGSAVDERALDRVEIDRVWAAVDRLPPAQRAAVTLRFGRDLPIAAIAAHMGRSEGAVKLLLNRGLTALRTVLDSGQVVEGSR
jgi:RNA polymerase sigma-70 factor (ECF subfamily)